MVMKFSKIVEQYENENNGRVVFIVIDDKNNIMGEYEEEEYNKGDEESCNAYKCYCNINVMVLSVTHRLAWTKVVCKVLESEVK